MQTILELEPQVDTAPTEAPAPSRPRFMALDGLRGISILFVLYAHALGTRGFHSTKFMERFAALGILGVQIFFVISGFLITFLLMQEKEQTGGISLKRFYIRRAFRILPVFYVFIGVIFVLKKSGVIAVAGLDLAAACLYVLNFFPNSAWWIAHIWSLSVEEQFYLIWPFAMKKFTNQACARMALATIAAVSLSRCFIFYYDPRATSLATRAAPQFGDVIAMGCLCALLLPALKKNAGLLRFLESPLWLLFPPAMIALNALWLRPDLCPVWIALPFGQVLISFFAAATITRITLIESGGISRILRWHPLAMLGVLSYSVYVWQQPFVNRNAHYIWNSFPLNIVCTAALASLSYFLLERPLLVVRRRFA